MKNILIDIEKTIINAESKLKPYSFNLKELPFHDNYNINIRKYKTFESIFESLNNKTNDCIYWFSTESVNQAIMLKNELNKKRESLKDVPDSRKVPVDNNNKNSKVLYLGVKKGGCRQYTVKNRKRVPDKLSFIAGRIIHHLGFYIKGSTQGLQLVHWAKDFDINITLNVLELNEKNSPYLYIIEKMYAIKLKPVLGKH